MQGSCCYCGQGHVSSHCGNVTDVEERKCTLMFVCLKRNHRAQEEEYSVYEEFMQNIKFQNGRYCVCLPWKMHHPLLPDNFSLCQTRQLELVKRLKQSPYIFRQYDNIIQDQISPGIVETMEYFWVHPNTLLTIPWCCQGRKIDNQA